MNARRGREIEGGEASMRRREGGLTSRARRFALVHALAALSPRSRRALAAPWPRAGSLRRRAAGARARAPRKPRVFRVLAASTWRGGVRGAHVDAPAPTITKPSPILRQL